MKGTTRNAGRRRGRRRCRRRGGGGIAAALTCLVMSSTSSVGAFVRPHHQQHSSSASLIGVFDQKTTRTTRTTATTTLRLYREIGGAGVPPPVPPPPPPKPDVIEQFTEEVTNALDRLDLSSIFGNSNNNNNNDVLGGVKDQLGQIATASAGNVRVVVDWLERGAQELRADMWQNVPASLRPAMEQLGVKFTSVTSPMMLSASASPFASALIAAGSTLLAAVVASNVLTWGQAPPVADLPYPTLKYNPAAAAAYFEKRLPTAVARAAEIAFQSLQFGLKVLKDFVDNKMGEMEEQRGRELAALLTRLGPTFIKVGQSLSIRTDLLSPGYARGLATLQDRVPAFDTEIAAKILEEEWGMPIDRVLAEPLTPEPIAAASLGQVYKARLKSTGESVAIKVQRPDITEQIALDMHLLRTVAPIVKTLFKLNTDTVGTVDTWGYGFVNELDYLQEASNAEFFTEQIATTPLKDVVFAPAVLREWTTGRVLTTAWVDGERLDQSDDADVTAVCSIAMNTYLTMMLDLGLLHCDPHPGNLLLVRDGDRSSSGGSSSRLAILDWGMTTTLSEDLQLTLLEHMAHLTSADYAEIPRDLLLLDFIPQSKAHLIEESGVVELLTEVYSSWKAGGGAKSVDINAVVSKLQDLTATLGGGNLFQIPPYFAYIAKSFSVLEGIGLSNDPKYSIVDECLPYVSRRLLTDKDSMGPALSTFIFGPEKTSADRIVDYKRVEQLVEGFGEYTTSASGSLLGAKEGIGSMSRTEILESAADHVLDLIFTREETTLQDILLEQLAKIVSSGGRSVWTMLRERSGRLDNGRTVLGTMIDPLGLWRTSPLVKMNELDEKTVETTLNLVRLAQKQIQGDKYNENNTGITAEMFITDLSREEAAEMAVIMARKFWDRRAGVLQTGGRFARKLLELTADTLERGGERERDTRTLPPTRQFNDHTTTQRTQQQQQQKLLGEQQQRQTTPPPRRRLPPIDKPSSSAQRRVNGNAKGSGSSARLSQARRRLEELQESNNGFAVEDGSSANVVVVPDAVPVKTTTKVY